MSRAKVKVRAINADKSMTTADLRGIKVGDAGAKVVVEALAKHECVTSIDLSYNNISDAGAQAISELLNEENEFYNAKIESINLFINDIGPAGAACIADSLTKNKALTTLGINIMISLFNHFFVPVSILTPSSSLSSFL